MPEPQVALSALARWCQVQHGRDYYPIKDGNCGYKIKLDITNYTVLHIVTSWGYNGYTNIDHWLVGSNPRNGMVIQTDEYCLVGIGWNHQPISQQMGSMAPQIQTHPRWLAGGFWTWNRTNDLEARQSIERTNVMVLLTDLTVRFQN